MITLHADTTTALASDSFEFAYLCALPGGLYYTNHSVDITYDGNVYLSNGLLMKFSDVKKDQAMKVGSYSLSLSNVPTSISNAYMTTSFRGYDATINLAIMEAGVIQGTPIILYKGTLDTWGTQETATASTLDLKLTSHWASYNKNSGRYTNNSVQQQIHSGDDFFKYSHADKGTIGWGK